MKSRLPLATQPQSLDSEWTEWTATTSQCCFLSGFYHNVIQLLGCSERLLAGMRNMMIEHQIFFNSPQEGKELKPNSLFLFLVLVNVCCLMKIAF